MGRLGKIALFGAIALAAPAGPLVAADMSQLYYETPTPYEVGSNWYLRGDLGYKWYAAPNASYPVPGYGDMKDESLSNTGAVGLGFGYRFNKYFRSDFTLDYEWPSHFKGMLHCPEPCTGQPGPEYSKQYADISAWSGLLNVYFDLDLSGQGLSGFIPYLGGGVGVSTLTTTKVHYANPNGTTGTWKGEKTTNLAWALTAGVAIPMSKNWLVDLNYRYVNLGNAQSGKTQASLGDKHIKYDDITASEARVGFRYLLN